MESMIFGPVPSRRLGRSIGVNNIPHKIFSAFPAGEAEVTRVYEIFNHHNLNNKTK